MPFPPPWREAADSEEETGGANDLADAQQMMKSLLARWAEEQRRRLEAIEPGIWEGIKDRLPPRTHSEPPPPSAE